MESLRCAAMAFSSNRLPANAASFRLRPRMRGAMIFPSAPPLRLTVVRVLDVEARCASIELDEQDRTVEADFVEGFRTLEQGALIFIAGRIDIRGTGRGRHGHDHGHGYGPVGYVFGDVDLDRRRLDRRRRLDLGEFDDGGRRRHVHGLTPFVKRGFRSYVGWAKRSVPT